MKNHTVSKKLISLFLTFLILTLSAPVAFAAEALTQNNVTQWPTISYNNPDGKMYYGQTLAEGLTINDDEVVLDAAGNQVAGHFEFVDPSVMQSYANNAKANLVFVPDDTDAYTGFKKNRSTVTYNVQKTTLVLDDENNPPVAASQIVKGATLSTVEITGGQVKNPYNATESNAAKATWTWVNPDTVVTESGEYEAKVQTTSSYEEFTRMIYVEVESTIATTTISELPIVEDIEYYPGIAYGDIELIGGKAVEYGTDTEVAGTFSVKNPDGIFRMATTYYIPIVFTPEDTESYAASECTVAVNVTKRSYKFVDENGEAIVPEITLSYGTTLKNVDSKLRAFIADRANLTGADVVGTFNYGEGIDKEAILPTGTKEYTVIVEPSGDGNYAATELKFELTIEPTPMEVRSSANSSNNVRILTVATKDAYAPAPLGTFAIYVDGTLLKEGLKVGETAEWIPEKSGAYELKVVYTPVENDPCVVETFTQTGKVNMIRTLTRVKSLPDGTTTVTYGEEVNLTANVLEENFGGWRITDANGNEVDLGIDTTSSKITFTMPDYDIKVEAIDKSESSSDGGLDIDNIFGDLTEGDSDNAILNIFNNIIAWFKNIIETIKGFFRSIGDLT